jgi:hypothetical protein
MKLKRCNMEKIASGLGIFALFVVFQGALPAHACVVDAYEPDDSSGSASTITHNSNQAHSICPAGDEDWIAFSLTTSSQVILETSGVTGDTRMWLYDSSISEIEYDDDDGIGYFSYIGRECATDPLPPGTYHIKIDEYGDNDPIDAYDLNLTVTECRLPEPEIRVEPLSMTFDVALPAAGTATAVTESTTNTTAAAQPDHKVHFKRGTVDPSIVAYAIASPQAAATSRRHLLMQFERLPTSAEKVQLASQGIHLLAYIPNLSYWVAIDPNVQASASATAMVPAAGGVRWTWVPDPIYKTSERIDAGDFPPNTKHDDGTVSIQVLLFADVDRRDATDVIDSLGGGIRVVRPLGDRLLEVGTPLSRISDIADLDQVRWLEPANPPRVEGNATAASRIYADVLLDTPYSIDASALTVGVWDGGAVDAHPDFDIRLTVVDPVNVSQHATHVAGTIGGSGLGNVAATGMAPSVQLRSYDWNQDMTEMRDAVISKNVVISNHSYGLGTGWEWTGTNWINYGSTGFGLYDVNAQEYDDIVYDTELLVFKAAGNDRDDGPDCPLGPNCDGPYDSIGHVGNAKNILTICALSDIDDMTGFSSWGPTNDGRVKPDLCANGDTLLSTLPGATYGAFSGTSMATPSAAGATALIYQHYQNEAALDPAAALIKALMIHAASDLGNTGPDYQHGWGIINAQQSVNLISTGSYIEGVVPATSHQQEFTFEVNGGDIKMTLAWTDPAGDPAAASALVNNLDLVLIASDGTPHYPWVLDPANPDLAASNGINNRDNVEQVFVSNPVTGTWTARVSGSAVPVGPQSFALIGTGINAGNARILTIFNDGNGPLSVTSIVPDQSAPWISVNPATLSVPAGGSLSALVEVDFTLAPPGSSTTRLLVYSDDPDENPYPGGVDITVITSCQDADNDSVCDDIDNCTLVSNPAQRDTDNDGYGNFCDPDFDNNLLVNAADLAFFKTLFFSTDQDADLDGNGIVNASDLAILKSMFFQTPGPSGIVP